MRYRSAALAAVAVLALAACTTPASPTAPSASPTPSSTTAGATGPAPGSPAPTTSPAAVNEPMDLSLLVFNVEYGGTTATDAVIKDIGADVVSVLESYARLPEMAKAAGYPYYDYGLQILSKYPILEPSGANGLYAYIEVRPGQAVALINTHLDYVQDGPTRLAKGVPVADVLAAEDQVRTSSIDKLLPSATGLLADGWPVLLTGDLNEPSHLDWTTATAAAHAGHGPVAWPVSEAVVGAGMTDAYRDVHPDPATDPGNTWGDVAGGNRHRMPVRIDYTYVGGPVQVRTSEVVGEQGGAGVDRGYPRWTSDHRAVYSTLQVTPATIPTTVALSSRLATVGDSVTATYVLPEGNGNGHVELSGAGSATYPFTGSSGTVTIDTTDLAPGRYDVTLYGDDGNPAAANELYVRPRDATVELTTDRSTYGVGDPITVRWSDGPANRWDWIGVFRAGAADPAKDDYLLWGYTGGHDAGALPPTTSGTMVIGPDSQGRPWPLPPGRYVAHYLLADQYASAGEVAFTVTAKG